MIWKTVFLTLSLRDYVLANKRRHYYDFVFNEFVSHLCLYAFVTYNKTLCYDVMLCVAH